MPRSRWDRGCQLCCLPVVAYGQVCRFAVERGTSASGMVSVNRAALFWALRALQFLGQSCRGSVGAPAQLLEGGQSCRSSFKLGRSIVPYRKCGCRGARCGVGQSCRPIPFTSPLGVLAGVQCRSIVPRCAPRQGSCCAWVNRAEVRGGRLRGIRGLSIVLLLFSSRSVNRAVPILRKSSSVCGELSVNRAAARRSRHLWALRSSIVRTVASGASRTKSGRPSPSSAGGQLCLAQDSGASLDQRNVGW